MNISLNKIIAIFGIVLVIFAFFVIYQFNKTADKASSNGPLTVASKVAINNHTFHVATAKSQEEQQTGLSGRSSLPQDQGMLFLFEKSDYHNFWMKNMQFPIDILYIKDNKIISIIDSAEPAPDNSNPQIYQPEAPANRVLEINAGLSKKYNIKKGDSVEIDL